MSRVDDLRERYAAALHAVQSGVSMKMNYDGADTTRKSLRVGINSTLIDTSAVAGLLMDKGIFNEEEYLSALVDAAEAEKARYEHEIERLTGTAVTLV